MNYCKILVEKHRVVFPWVKSNIAPRDVISSNAPKNLLYIVETMCGVDGPMRNVMFGAVTMQHVSNAAFSQGAYAEKA
jgi:hypothetical protein